MALAMPRALFPEVADDRFHGAVGPLYSAIAIGSVLAGLSSGWISRVRRQGRGARPSRWSAGARPSPLSGLARSCGWSSLLLAVAGAADLVSAVYRQTILQTYAPDEMRGRMQGVFTAVVGGGPRLGDVRAGATAATVGVTAWSGSAAGCLHRRRDHRRERPLLLRAARTARPPAPTPPRTGGQGEPAEDAGENDPQAEDRRAS